MQSKGKMYANKPDDKGSQNKRATKQNVATKNVIRLARKNT